jgi:phosphotransferase system HPr (HPr) family protein
MSQTPRAAARVEVKNERGLHARAARTIVLALKPFSAELTVTRDDQTVDGRSILSLMTLAAAPGTMLDLVAEGPDAEAVIAALTALFEARFHED